MKFQKENILLPLIFVLTFGFRLAFLIIAPYFSSDQAYFHLRHTEFITNNFYPMVYDPLSYGGQVILDTQVYHYFLAFFDSVATQFLAFKVVPALLASSVVLIVYILAKELTKSKRAALFSALLSAFIPIYFDLTLNQVSLTSLTVPLFLLLLYTLITIRTNKTLFMFFSVILIWLEPLNLLMFFTFILFIVLLISESLKIRQDEKEAIGLHLVLFVLMNIIFFRKLYLSEGLTAVWQNTPPELYGSVFQSFDLFQTISLIGIIPLVLGIIGLLLSYNKNRLTLLLGAVLLADFSLLLLKLINFEQGVLLLAVTFCVTSAVSISRFIDYVSVTKVSRFIHWFMFALVVVSLASLVYPSTVVSLDVINDGVTEGEVEALTWIKDNAAEGSVVIGNVYEGNIIAYYAERANVIDTHFFTAENRLLDIETVFTTESLVKASQAMAAYDVDYIYFSDKTKELYGVEELSYTNDESCFSVEFENEDATVYRTYC